MLSVKREREAPGHGRAQNPFDNPITAALRVTHSPPSIILIKL